MTTDSGPTFHQWLRTMLAHRHGASGVHQDTDHASEVYQTSTMTALLDGVYDGDVTIGELLSHGDFGLGTFNRLNGEMLVLDGVCHHLHADGTATIAGPEELTPFATVTWFHPDHRIEITEAADRTAVTTTIDQALGTANLIVAVRITGKFDQVRTRTVTEQQRPYPPLTEATTGQQEADFSGIHGTLAGFRMPDYEQGIAVAGYHLHFIDDARSQGGHALDYRLRTGTVEISVQSEMHLSLPRTALFLDANLNPADLGTQIRQTEGS
jgi:acetolactate decarboxylase